MAGGPAVRHLTWPRNSPPGFAAVCRLTYHRPAFRSATCAGVSVAVPVIGLEIGPGNGTTTPALLPAAAGPWKWPAVTGPVVPEYVTVHFRVVPSRSTLAVPVPALALGGTSFAPVRGTVIPLPIIMPDEPIMPQPATTRAPVARAVARAIR